MSDMRRRGEREDECVIATGGGRQYDSQTQKKRRERVSERVRVEKSLVTNDADSRGTVARCRTGQMSERDGESRRWKMRRQRSGHGEKMFEQLALRLRPLR